MWAISETGCKMAMGNLGGTMGLFIEETTIMVSDKAMVNFITLKIPVSAEDFGKEVSSMDRASMCRVRISASSAFGVREDLLD
jgi:hypothetical protein